MTSVLRHVIRIVKITTLILCFSAQVHVRADMNVGDSPSHLLQLPDYVQEPARCLSQPELVCGLKTRDKAVSLKIDGSLFNLGANSVLIRSGSGSWYISKGTVWVRSLETLQLKTKYGLVSSASEMNVMIEVQEEIVYLTPLLENAVLVRSGSGEALTVEPGLELRLKGFTQEGFTDFEVPLSSHPKNVIMKWSKVFKGEPREFSESVSRYLALWFERTEEVARTQKNIMQREIASAERVRKRKEEQRKRYEAESLRMRNLFRKKTYY